MERAILYFGSLAAPTYTTITRARFFPFPPLRTPARQAKCSWSLDAFYVLCLSECCECSYVVHRDGDGVPDGFDNCVDLPNGEQADADGDKIGIEIVTVKDRHFWSREQGCYSYPESKPCEYLTVWSSTFGAKLVTSKTLSATTFLYIKLFYRARGSY